MKTPGPALWHTCPQETDPFISDTDGDGLADGEEVLRETFPTNPLATDTNDDGLSDLNELVLGINPTKPDTDGDGLGDADEVRHGFDANVATEAPEGHMEIFRAVELQFFTLPGKHTSCSDPVTLIDGKPQANPSWLKEVFTAPSRGRKSGPFSGSFSGLRSNHA
jgi:hypothetical protein